MHLQILCFPTTSGYRVITPNIHLLRHMQSTISSHTEFHLHFHWFNCYLPFYSFVTFLFFLSQRASYFYLILLFSFSFYFYVFFLHYYILKSDLSATHYHHCPCCMLIPSHAIRSAGNVRNKHTFAPVSNQQSYYYYFKPNLLL